MRAIRLLVASCACALLLAPPLAPGADAQGRGGARGRLDGPPPPVGGIVAPLGQRRGGQEPAYAKGYADGYQRGRADASRGERYDPANNREYRDGDDGYSDSYGSRDGYRTNYRAGFRKGYEDGYRSVQR